MRKEMHRGVSLLPSPAPAPLERVLKSLGGPLPCRSGLRSTTLIPPVSSPAARNMPLPFTASELISSSFTPNRATTASAPSESCSSRLPCSACANFSAFSPYSASIAARVSGSAWARPRGGRIGCAPAPTPAGLPPSLRKSKQKISWPAAAYSSSEPFASGL